MDVAVSMWHVAIAVITAGTPVLAYDGATEELLAILGVEPDITHRKGDPMGKLGGDVRYKVLIRCP